MTQRTLARSALFAAAFLVVTPMSSLAQQDEPVRREPAETKPQRDARMAWWRDARFGLFIHWGVYSVPAGQYKGKTVPGYGEWIMNDAKIPQAEYDQYPPQFNPKSFDADTWVTMAKNAGMKYVVLTAKHHDGFALFDSKVGNYNVMTNSPFKRDIVKELADACGKQNMPFGLYYSQDQDWHQPGGGAMWGQWDEKQKGDFDRYFDSVAIPQVKELLANYGPITTLWFDTPGKVDAARARRMLAVLKDHPNLIINDRLGGGFDGDTSTPEQHVPATGFKNRDWETCMTINNTWGFKSSDTNWKSTAVLLRHLIDIASKGGNYLLNVGPDADGNIPPESVERLKEIGTWMKINGDAIYGTTASPFKRLPFNGRATVKGNDLYLHVFEWPSEGITLPGLQTEIRSADFVDGGTAARVTRILTDRNEPAVSIAAPAKIDPIATVVRLRLAGPPTIDPASYAISPAASGVLELKASQADTTGRAQYESEKDKDCIGYWTDSDSTAAWTVRDVPAGKYKVEVTYACEKGEEGTPVELIAGAARASFVVERTGSWSNFKTVAVGEIDIAADVSLVTAKPGKLARSAVMNLRGVTLTPVR